VRRPVVAVLLFVVLSVPLSAWAQATSVKHGIVGAWSFVPVVSQTGDGTRGEPFGANPKGIMIFAADGHFALFQSTAELPRLAANDRTRATPEEAVAVVRESIACCDTRTVKEAAREASPRLVGSTYMNLAGSTPQRRIITTLMPSELAFSDPRTPSSVSLHTVRRRAEAR
jgi:hypothetical protein